MGEGSPLGRLGDPRESGRRRCPLRRPVQSSFIAGIELSVDGGVARSGWHVSTPREHEGRCRPHFHLRPAVRHERDHHGSAEEPSPVAGLLAAH
jgi:hypothetical protein